MRFIPSMIFEFLGSPWRLALLILAFGAALAYTRFAKWSRYLTTPSAVLLLLMAFGLVGHMLAIPLEARFPTQPDDIEAPDGIVVLGGSVGEMLGDRRGRVNFAMAAGRVTTPMELVRRFPKAKLVFTGGSVSLDGSPVSEAQAVRQIWRAAGVERRDTIYEDRSRDILESAAFTRDLVKPTKGERWLLVASAMHMPLAIGVFRKAGFPVIAYPVDFRASGDFWRPRVPEHTGEAITTVDLATREWLELLAYRLTGKTDSLFPAP